MVDGLSVNTNSSANIALQQLTILNTKIQSTQLRITTGLKVSGPKDDAATFQIATRLRGDVAGLGAVKTALANGDSIVSVAISAGNAIADLLTEIKAKAVQANQSGLDTASRSALDNDFQQLRTQIETIVSTADFNNVNLIDQSASNLDVLSSVDGSVINVSAQKLDTTTLGINTASLSTSSAASSALTAIETAIDLAADKLAALGSSATGLEIQSQFTTSLINLVEEGIGNLVDADLAEESAKLQALQVQQQLSVQALAIANSAPSLVLGLFPIPGGSS
ncbi:MAG: flagellin [Alphaproteobacteria bacterium]